MEQEKRALAEEARRRTTARVRAKPSAEEIMNVRPIVPHRGPLTPEEKARARLLYLQGILRQFKAIEEVLREDGETRAADMWRHYLESNGDAVVFSPSEMRAYSVMKDAETALNRYFLDWMTAPVWEERTEQTPDGPVATLVKSDLERLGPELLSMKDGETKFARSNWDRRLRYPSYWAMRNDGEDRESRDLYAFLGEAQLRANGGFRFTRRGDAIEFDGTVAHGFNEPFNFDAGRNLPDPSWSKTHASGAEGELLQKEELAKPFDMRAQWTQRVRGRLKIDPSGRLVLDGIPIWTDVDPSARWP
jgi:hypothetical protein